MLKEENGDTSNKLARMCDTCQSAKWTVYCRADAAYLCTGCDARIHAANQAASQHERVFICEACERAPAAFLCKADAAYLCTTCDADIHSANPLARRHKRVPILPTPGSLSGPSLDMDAEDEFLTPKEEGDDEADNNNGEASSVSQQRPSKGTIDLSSRQPIQMPTQISTMDRVARVLRYLKKKKMRKFKKTIRYASRKAYADTRPRIKGRFAKSANVDQMFSTRFIADSTGYCIVSSNEAM